MHHEENFEEAIRSVNFAYNRTSLPENIRLILKDEKLKNLTSNVSIQTKYCMYFLVIRDYLM